MHNEHGRPIGPIDLIYPRHLLSKCLYHARGTSVRVFVWYENPFCLFLRYFYWMFRQCSIFCFSVYWKVFSFHQLPFWSTWVHPRFSMGFMLLDL